MVKKPVLIKDGFSIVVFS